MTGWCVDLNFSVKAKAHLSQQNSGVDGSFALTCKLNDRCSAYRMGFDSECGRVGKPLAKRLCGGRVNVVGELGRHVLNREIEASLKGGGGLLQRPLLLIFLTLILVGLGVARQLGTLIASRIR